MGDHVALDCWRTSGRAATADSRWYVLHARSRQEKALAADLRAMDVPHYLPLVNSVRFYGKRKARVEMPLFPGYLFLLGEVDDAYRADRTGRLARVIPVPDQQGLERELQSLRVVLESGAELDPYPYLQKGVWVELRSGPFRGARGLVEDRLRADRLILQVDVLGQATSLEIDGALLDVIEPAAAAV